MRRGWLVLIGLQLTATIASCGDLEEIEPDRCGNDVLENNEDCDSFVPDEALNVCNPPGSTGQCRYSCDDRGDGTFAECPTGYGCGRDGICRRHSGKPEPVRRSGKPAGLWIATGDFDADGFDDVVGVNEAALSVDYYELGNYRQSHIVPIEPSARPSVSFVNSDNRADVIVPTDLGLAVFTGASGRTLSPSTYATLSFRLLDDQKGEPIPFKFMPINLVPEVVEVTPGPSGGTGILRFPGDEPLTLTSIGAFPLANRVTTGFIPGGEDTLTFDVSRLRGEPVVARFDETVDEHDPYTESPEQFAIALAHQTDAAKNAVIVLRPSYYEGVDMMGDPLLYYFVDAMVEEGPGKPTVPPTHPTATHIDLGGYFVASRLHVANVNGENAMGLSRVPCGPMDYAISDEHLDLVLVGQQGSTIKVLVAYGLGDGTFHGDPCELDEIEAMIAVPDNSVDEADELSGCGQLLAVGDIDDDGWIDLVTTTHTRLSGLLPAGRENDPLGLCDDVTAIPHPNGGEWSSAGLGDFNGDGRLDVMGALDKSPGVDFLASYPGSLLNHAKLVTPAGVIALRLGDFDGDGIVDAGLAENRGEQHTMSVIFGERGELPSPPIEVGALTEIGDAQVSNTPQPRESFVDGAEDIYVANATDDDGTTRIAVLHGRADRALRAPFTFSVDSLLGLAERYVPDAASVSPFAIECGETGRSLIMTGTSLDVGTDLPNGMEHPEVAIGAACVDELAGMSPLGAAPSELSVRGSKSAMAAIDVDGDGFPDPILIAWEADLTSDAGRHIEIMAPVSEGSGDSLTWPQPRSATIENATIAGSRAHGGTEPLSQLRNWASDLTNNPTACTLTEDGQPSLLFIGVVDDGECDGEPSAQFDLAARSVLYAIPAETLGGIRGGGSLDGIIELTAEGDQTIISFTCANLDEDPEDEVALLTLVGSLDTCDGTPRASDLGAHVIIADFVDGSFTLQLDPPYAVLTDDDAFLLDNPGTTRAPLSGIVRGDFNGDGVHDLAVGGRTDTFVWLGRPVNP